MVNLKEFTNVMGFCGDHRFICEKDGSVQLNEGRYAETDPDVIAFKDLAALAGSPKTIDEQDLLRLEYDPQRLAGLIRSNPFYRNFSRNSGLVYENNKNIHRASTVEGLTDRSNKRLVFYFQMALQVVVDPTLEPTGVFDTATAGSIYAFQKTIGYDSALRGSLINDRIAANLVVLLERKGEVLNELREQETAISNLQFYITKGVESHNPILVEAEKTVIDALQWLGYVDRQSDTSTPRGRQKISSALSKNFGGALIVGPLVIRQIRERVASTYE